MTDPISHFSRMAQMDSNVRQATKAEKRPSDPALAAEPAPQAPAGDQLQLSEVARQAMREPEFDRAKVDAIRQALQRGEYPVDSRRIAESFVALERMIKG